MSVNNVHESATYCSEFRAVPPRLESHADNFEWASLTRVGSGLHPKPPMATKPTKFRPPSILAPSPDDSFRPRSILDFQRCPSFFAVLSSRLFFSFSVIFSFETMFFHFLSCSDVSVSIRPSHCDYFFFFVLTYLNLIFLPNRSTITLPAHTVQPSRETSLPLFSFLLRSLKEPGDETQHTQLPW